MRLYGDVLEDNHCVALVTSRMLLLQDQRQQARIADSRPEPGPLQ